MDLRRIRKALAAGVSAGGLAVGTAINNNGVPGNVGAWAGLVGLAASAFIVAAVITYATKANAPEPAAGSARPDYRSDV